MSQEFWAGIDVEGMSIHGRTSPPIQSELSELVPFYFVFHLSNSIDSTYLTLMIP